MRKTYHPRGFVEGLSAFLIRGSLKLLLKPAFSPRWSIDAQRRWLARLARTTLMPAGVSIEPATVGGVPGEWLRRHDTPPVRPGVILYLHGGAYCVGSALGHRALTSRIALASGLPVFSLDYRLAPEHRFPAAIDDVVAAFHALSELGPVIIAGDSAGGGLALAAALALRDADAPRPAALVLLSPWVDMTPAGMPDTIPAGECMLSSDWASACAAHYLGDASPESLLASPLHADLRGLPPTLIQAGTDANAKVAAKAKAEKVLQEVKAQPARFAELAKKFSDDPGSAAKGGDLGNFTRDMMVKPFSDAAYQLKVGEISGLVESQFGYHIIRVDGISPGAQIGFDTVKADIMRELQGQEAARKFAEAAERFSNMVYEQPDSLEPAAREFKLKLEESGWVQAGNAQPAILSNPRLIDAIFGSDALAKRQNTEAIEVAPNTLVAARVLEHRPASTRPLAEVAPMIRLKLQNEAAGKKAAEAGQQALQAAQNGQAPSGLSAPMTVSRMRPLNLPPVAIKAIFKANATKLPAWTGVETADGYRLYRINQVMPGEMPPEQTKAMRRDLQRLFAQAEMRAYIDGLKAKSEVKVNQDLVDKKAE